MDTTDEGTRRVRQPVVAGAFYPSSPGELGQLLASLLDDAPARDPHEPAPKAIVAPHAGYIYSGPIAARAYRAIEARRGEVERVVLIGPSHRVPVAGMALPSAGAFATPLGQVAIDDDARRNLLAMPTVAVNDDAHRDEHSLEVQVPFLQHVLGDDWKLVPIAVGRTAPLDVADVLAALWGGSETAVVVSTDLSHYHDYATASEVDRRTAEAIVARDVGAISTGDACGAHPLRGLIELTRRAGLDIELLDVRNSGDTAGDRTRVVGYGAFAVV